LGRWPQVVVDDVRVVRLEALLAPQLQQRLAVDVRAGAKVPEDVGGGGQQLVAEGAAAPRVVQLAVPKVDKLGPHAVLLQHVVRQKRLTPGRKGLLAQTHAANPAVRALVPDQIC